MSPTTAELDTFFPLPSAAPSTLSPARLPGVTRTSGDALVKVLRDNHVKWHAFFNDKGYHNHAAHHLVAIYALGAGGPLIEAAYETHVVYMMPAFESPEPVTEENYWKHLGKRNFYNSYLEYFRALLLKRSSTSEVLEEYIFSAKANIGGKGIEGQPKMLSRFLANILHPMIHVGCGLEFGILGLVAEGLAQSAVHPSDGEHLVPAALFQNDRPGMSVSRLSALLPSLTLRRGSESTAAGKRITDGKNRIGAHALEILARILADEKFSPASLSLPVPEGESPFKHVQTVLGNTLFELTAEWAAELESQGATDSIIAKKIEELAWMNVLIYGVGGWARRDKSRTKEFNANFFYMHLVTSSLFLPSIITRLSASSAALLLRTYFSISIAWYVALGRPALPIKAFYDATTDKPVLSDQPRVPPSENTLTPSDMAPNPWLPIVQATLVHPSEHLCKLQRALVHYTTLYGTKSSGDFARDLLEGADVLDGTLFIRVAGLTAKRVGSVKDSGEVAHEWDLVDFI